MIQVYEGNGVDPATIIVVPQFRLYHWAEDRTKNYVTEWDGDASLTFQGNGSRSQPMVMLEEEARTIMVYWPASNLIMEPA